MKGIMARRKRIWPWLPAAALAALVWACSPTGVDDPSEGRSHVVVFGQVLRATGNPVPGARIVVEGTQVPCDERPLPLAPSLVIETDEEGMYEAHIRSRVAPRQWCLQVSAIRTRRTVVDTATVEDIPVGLWATRAEPMRVQVDLVFDGP